MSNDFANRFSALLGKNNSSIFYTLGSECWKVIVIRIDVRTGIVSIREISKGIRCTNDHVEMMKQKWHQAGQKKYPQSTHNRFHCGYLCDL